MTEAQKEEILVLLNEHAERFESQRKAVDALKNVSEATVISIRKRNWNSIKDEMWLNVGKQLGWSAVFINWAQVDTSVHRNLTALFLDAQTNAGVHAVTASAGSGKSNSAKVLSTVNKLAYHVSCSEYFNKKTFLMKILEAMNIDHSGYTVHEMVERISDTILKQQYPLLILDEVDKLRDEVLYFFISIYNLLEDKCGIVLLATEFLEKRIERGRKLGKKGYSEIYSRIGRKFINLPLCTDADIKLLCVANGVQDALEITKITNECDKDLRRVKKAVHRYKLMQK